MFFHSNSHYILLRELLFQVFEEFHDGLFLMIMIFIVHDVVVEGFQLRVAAPLYDQAGLVADCADCLCDDFWNFHGDSFFFYDGVFSAVFAPVADEVYDISIFS